MKNLKIIELFSGTGMQRRGLENTKCFSIDSICTSEIDIDAIIAYAACHCNLTTELIESYNYPPIENMIEELSKKNIGFDSVHNKTKQWKTDKNSIIRLKKVYLADKLQNNIGDITTYKNPLPNADLWFYSFPCTDISNAGSMKGLDGSTRSGLLYEVERLLNLNKQVYSLPKYLILENVDDLVNKKFKPYFESWLNVLDSLGYNNYWSIMDAADYGVPQTRKRIFCISILKSININLSIFPKKFDTKKSLKDYLENIDTIPHEICLNSFNKDALAWIPSWLEKQENYTIIRHLTPIESMKLMGLSEHDINAILNLKISKTAIYRITGNGIVTDCIKLIGQHLYKAIYDNEFICDDELELDLVEPKKPICLNKNITNTIFKTHSHQPSLQDRVYDSSSIAVSLTTSFLPYYIQRKE